MSEESELDRWIRGDRRARSAEECARSRLASVLHELEGEPPPLLAAEEAEQLRLSILERARRNKKRRAILRPVAVSVGALAALLLLVVAGRLVAPRSPAEPAPTTANGREVHLVLRTAETEVRFLLSVPGEAPGKGESAR